MLRSIAAAWPYCVYAVLALVLAMIADTGGSAVGCGSATGRVAAVDGQQVARGLAIAADAAAWTGTSAADDVAHAGLVAPLVGLPLPGADHARRKLPRGPPTAVA